MQRHCRNKTVRASSVSWRQLFIGMKHLLLFCVTLFSLSVACGQTNGISPGKVPELRKEHKEVRDGAGNLNASIDTFFRGAERVMVTVKQLPTNKYGIKKTRAYFANGKDVVDEICYDDGTQVIRLYKDGDLCEMFRRQVDGSCEPVSGDELAKLKGQQQELVESLKQ